MSFVLHQLLSQSKQGSRQIQSGFGNASKRLGQKDGQGALQNLPSVMRRQTQSVIALSKDRVTELTSGKQWHNPNPLHVLATLDSISNDCCEIADSCTILYRQYAPHTARDPTSDLNKSVVDCNVAIVDFFNSDYLNMNPKLLTLLHKIASDELMCSLLEPEDDHLLVTFLNFLTQQQKPAQASANSSLDVQQAQASIQHLSRQFMQNISQASQQAGNQTVRMSKEEILSVPSKIFQKRLLENFDKNVSMVDCDLSPHEFQLLNFSASPRLRQIWFANYTNKVPQNSILLAKMLQHRSMLAEASDQTSFFAMQLKQQTLKVAYEEDAATEFLTKLDKIRALIRPQTLKDIDSIKKITGVKDVRYEDQMYLKGMIRDVLLSKDPQNIQMLKCFTLSNVLQGLCLLLQKTLRHKISDSWYERTSHAASFQVSTLVLDQNTGDLLDKVENTFDFSSLSDQKGDQEGKIVLFVFDIEGRGKIVLDLFQRAGSKEASRTQQFTLTERGSSTLTGQTGVAYIAGSFPREDIQYLSYEVVKTLFHEFGHGLNISLSQSKYQHVSGARSTTDLMEIPSHFVEHYLRDYSFVRQFALVPVSRRAQNDQQGSSDDFEMKPISKQIFNKMLFSEEVFQFIELEESLFFTSMDVEFHSLKPTAITEEKLQEITFRLAQKMTVNHKLNQHDLGGQNPPAPTDEVDDMIAQAMFEDKLTIDDIYQELSRILFSRAGVTDLGETMEQMEVDAEKVRAFEKNYLYCRFHHLFDYQATYYSYLLAKLCSKKLFSGGLKRAGAGMREQVLSRGEEPFLSKDEIDLLFARSSERAFTHKHQFLNF